MSNSQIATLQQQLEAMTKHGLEVLPKEVTEAFERQIGELRESGVGKGLTVGAKAPDFTLSNHAGDNVNLCEELAKGPVILTFYRGEWCPFCNLELRAYQRIMDDIRESGAQLLAVSPLTPDRSLSMQSKNELSFHVLSDSGNRTAEAYALKFKLPEPLQHIYRSLGFALEQFNGDESWELPVPATYVIDTQRTIRLASVNPDYRTRMEPGDVLSFVRSM